MRLKNDKQDQFFIIYFSSEIFKYFSDKYHPENSKNIRIVFFYLFPIRKKIALQNLNICFPDKDNGWKREIIKKSYINLFLNLFEFLKFRMFSKKNINKFAFYGGNIPVQEVVNRDYPKFFLSAHFSNWEFLAYCFPFIFDDYLNIIVKTQSNIILDHKINEFRESSGNKIIPMGVTLREVYKKINSNEIICFLIDQSAHSEYSVYVNFFNKNVASYAGPSKLALKYRPKLIFSYIVREKNYKYTFYGETIDYEDLKESSEENVIILTQRIQSKLQDIVIKYPEQWLWFHRRFKYVKN